MPFTFAHPAIVLPLYRHSKRWFSLTGLVVGSLAPDFEYFIRMKVSSSYSHTLWGVFWFDLPLSVVLAFLFHVLVRNELLKNLPAFLYLRLYVYQSFNWVSYFKNNMLIVIISILIGAFSHLFWDSFTHGTGYFVAHFPTLQNLIFVGGHSFPVFKLLQHLSTLLGIFGIVCALLQLPVDKDRKPKNYFSYWLAVVSISSFVLSLRFFSGLPFWAIGDWIVSAISGLLIALLLAPSVLKSIQ